jgi:hypothetical protein
MTGRKIAAKMKRNSFYSYEMNFDTALQWSLEYSYLQICFVFSKRPEFAGIIYRNSY